MRKPPERDEAPSATADAGSLKRGVQILKLLATVGARGLALSEIAARAGLPHPSAHRVLKQLLDDRLVSRNDDIKRYRLGPLAFELGIACSTMYGDLRELCSEAMDKLSEETGDTSYLVVRSGFEAVCMHRHEGAFPIRALILDIGGRRPLGVGAGGLALLAAIGEEERHEIIERVGPKLGAFGGMTVEDLENACVRTSKNGTSVIHDTLSLGVSAVGHAFYDALGQPVGALSVAALSHRMTGERVRRIAELLKDGCALAERRMQRHHLNGWKTGP
ncbi:IclR family transcriptional regulator C-terminal domain-containing protein [Variovorax humicola]|uniref:IclR family transcriptional regulator C-terminal domain-containing protein n=1 Tax=Variovorax humicola TaxID=1769758 RepID=A0ABU8W347_9BURK